jgi:hypothetical protein
MCVFLFSHTYFASRTVAFFVSLHTAYYYRHMTDDELVFVLYYSSK